jgi:hypothetical protein
VAEVNGMLSISKLHAAIISSTIRQNATQIPEVNEKVFTRPA